MSKALRYLSFLHVCNDGFQSSFLLLLPFIAKDLSISLTQVGLLGSSFGILNVFMALPAGYFASRFGGLQTIIFAVLLYGLGFIGVGFTASYLMLIGVFLVGGIGYSVFHPIAFALVSRWADKRLKGRAMGDFTAIGDVGRIGLSAAVTYIVAFSGWRFTSLLFGGFSLTVFVLFYLLHIKKNTHVSIQKTDEQTIHFKHFLQNKKFVFSAIAGAIDNIACSSLFIFLPFLLLQRNIEPSLLGSFAAAYFIGNFSGKTVLGRFVDKFGAAKVFIFAEIAMAVFIVLLAHATSIVLIIGCSLILGALTKGTAPVTVTMTSDAIEHHGNYEKAFGIRSTISNIGETLSPLLLGFISDKFGIVQAFDIAALVALLTIFPTIAYMKAKKSHYNS